MFRTRKRDDRSPAVKPRTRLGCEPLEDRTVPAAVYWVSQQTPDAEDPNNWSSGQRPTSADDIYLDGAKSNVNCDGLGGSPTYPYRSIRLVNGYAGHFAARHNAIAVVDLELASGHFDQPSNSYSDSYESAVVNVFGTFTWTGGTLNSTTNRSGLRMQPGSVMQVVPPDGVQLVTGSDLVLLSTANGQGATATVRGSTPPVVDGAGIHFNNAAGFRIGADAPAPPTKEALLTINDKVNFTAADGRSTFDVRTGGKFTVKGPGVYVNSELPLGITGGTVLLDGGATASFTKQFPAPPGQPPAPGQLLYNIGMSDGQLLIRAGSTLAATHAVRFDGGELITLAAPAGQSQTATIDTPYLQNNGARVLINSNRLSPNTPIVSGVLLCTGDVFWSAGTFDVYLDGTTGTADVWEAKLKFTVGQNAVIVVHPLGNPPNMTTTFLFLQGSSVVGTPPNNLPAAGGMTFVVLADTPATKWSLQRSA